MYIQQCGCSYLDNKGLVLKSWGQAHHAHVGRLVDEVLDAMENSSTGGGDTTMDTSLADGLSGHTRMGVNVLQIHTRRNKTSSEFSNKNLNKRL